MLVSTISISGSSDGRSNLFEFVAIACIRISE